MTGMSDAILVAEDDLSIRELLQEALEQEGLRVITAHDGEEAVRLALADKPAAVVLDLGLPFVDGAEVAARIRAAYGEGVPFIVVTATQRYDEIPKLRAASFLTKPFQVSEFVNAVRAAIGPPPAGAPDPATSPA